VVFHAVDPTVLANEYKAVVGGGPVEPQRPGDRLDAQLRDRHRAGEAPPEGAIHLLGSEAVDDVPVAGKNGEADLDAGSRFDVLPDGPVALHLPEDVLLRDQSDGQLGGRCDRGHRQGEQECDEQ
jgi:hypothetical protein